MIYNPELKKIMLDRMKWLNEFIRGLEDFAVKCHIDIANDKIYIAAIAQRQVLRDIIDNKFH